MRSKSNILILLLVVTIPQITFAAWWNPISWTIFSRFSPKVDTAKVATSTNDVARPVDEVSEIKKLKAELEELKSQKNDSGKQKAVPTAQTSVKQNIPVTISTPTSQTTAKTMSRDEMFTDVMQKYTTFQSEIDSEKNKVTKNSSLASERRYLVYLKDLLVKISANIGYLSSIENWHPRPVDIEEIYLSKFNNLKSEYDAETKRYIVEREYDRKSYIDYQVQVEKESLAQAALDRQKNVKDIKVKIAEMDQLITQIGTLDGSSLMLILNDAKKLDSSTLFYTFEYICRVGGQKCPFYYPYENKNYDNNYYLSDLRAGLRAIVANYKAFLNVELAKNQ